MATMAAEKGDKVVSLAETVVATVGDTGNE
jgi:hypothetical protein